MAERHQCVENVTLIVRHGAKPMTPITTRPRIWDFFLSHFRSLYGSQFLSTVIFSFFKIIETKTPTVMTIEMRQKKGPNSGVAS